MSIFPQLAWALMALSLLACSEDEEPQDTDQEADTDTDADTDADSDADTDADSDTDTGAYNASPVAAITSHPDHVVFSEASTVLFQGLVHDVDHPTEDLLATWYLGGDESCAATAPSSDGATSCEATLDLDDTSLVLMVVDPRGATGSAEISLMVAPDEAPAAVILSPEPGGAYHSDQPIDFEGLVHDSEDEPTDLTASWVSSLDGVLSVAAAPDTKGQVLGTGYLSEGGHRLTLHVEDSLGQTGSSSVDVTVAPPAVRRRSR